MLGIKVKRAWNFKSIKTGQSFNYGGWRHPNEFELSRSVVTPEAVLPAGTSQRITAFARIFAWLATRSAATSPVDVFNQSRMKDIPISCDISAHQLPGSF